MFPFAEVQENKISPCLPLYTYSVLGSKQRRSAMLWLSLQMRTAEHNSLNDGEMQD